MNDIRTVTIVTIREGGKARYSIHADGEGIYSTASRSEAFRVADRLAARHGATFTQRTRNAR